MYRTKGLFVCLSGCLSVCLCPINVKGKNVDNQYFFKFANLNRKIRQHLRII